MNKRAREIARDINEKFYTNSLSMRLEHDANAARFPYNMLYCAALRQSNARRRTRRNTYEASVCMVVFIRVLVYGSVCACV